MSCGPESGHVNRQSVTDDARWGYARLLGMAGSSGPRRQRRFLSSYCRRGFHDDDMAVVRVLTADLPVSSQKISP
jgi:hypothetical protein